jgi:hypothetical protein
VVGQRDGRAAVFRRPPAQAVNAAGAIQERVLTVNVEMNELAHRTALKTSIVKLKKQTN